MIINPNSLWIDAEIYEKDIEIPQVLEKEDQSEIASTISIKKSDDKKTGEQLPEEISLDDSKNVLEHENENVLKIEIPEILSEELPKNFSVDELGKVDLNEAENIAEEDILSLTNANLLQEFGVMDIMPEHDKEIPESKSDITDGPGKVMAYTEEKSEAQEDIDEELNLEPEIDKVKDKIEEALGCEG